MGSEPAITYIIRVRQNGTATVLNINQLISVADKLDAMKEMKVPEGYQQLMPYLIIKDAAGFISFMQQVFGAEEIMKHMRSEGVIMHAEIKIGECVIMLADSTSEYPPRTGGFFIYVADADETYNKAIAAGAVSVTPVSDQPYGRSCGIADPFGNMWWPTTAA